MPNNIDENASPLTETLRQPAIPSRAHAPPAKRRGRGSKPRIPQKLHHALKLLAAGAETVEIAAERAGISRSGLYAALERVHVVAELHRMCERDIAVLGVVRAKAQIIKLIDSESPYVALDASKTILGHAGVLRTSDPGRRGPTAAGLRISFVTVNAQNGATGVQVTIDQDKNDDDTST